MAKATQNAYLYETFIIFINNLNWMWHYFVISQSRVKNSSFYNDTDTVNTVMESVDSTSIIEEQKRIAAEEARLQERKAELDKLSKNFNQKKDEFSNKTWIFRHARRAIN